MTPEAAHELGKRSTVDMIAELSGSLYDGTPAGLLHTIEADVEQRVADHADAIDVIAIPLALRGSAAFWRDFADQLEARAASLEAGR